MARADTSSGEFGAGPVWLAALEIGARNWMSALTGLAEIGASTAEAQTEIAGDMILFWMRGFPPSTLPNSNFLRGELLFAGIQAERVADAARRTLEDLSEPKGEDLPIPLPE